MMYLEADKLLMNNNSVTMAKLVMKAVRVVRVVKVVKVVKVVMLRVSRGESEVVRVRVSRALLDG